MRREILALEENETCEVCDLPKGKKAIWSKWVYKAKLHPDGSVERLKARVVALGFHQVEGKDYTDTFSPMAKIATVKIVISVALMKGWEIFHVYVDDMMVTWTSISQIEEVNKHLHEAFTINNLGGLKYFQGIEKKNR